MKLILLILLIFIETCFNNENSLNTQEEILKSMSVFDILDNNHPPPAPIINQQPSMFVNSNFPQPSINIINPNLPSLMQQKIVNKNVKPAYNRIVTKKIPSLPIEQMLEKLKSKVTNPYLRANFTLPNIANFFANFISGNEHLNNVQVKELARLKKVDVSDRLNVRKKAYIKNLEFTNLQSHVMNVTENEITFNPETIIRMKNSIIAFKVKDIFEVIAFMKYILKICGSRLEKCDFKNLLNINKTEEILNIIKFMTSQKINLKNTSTASSIPKPPSPAPILKKIVEPVIVPKQNKRTNLRRNEYNFRQKNDIDLEKEINYEISHYEDPKSSSLESEYINLLENPEIQQYMNDYYYSARIFE